MIPTALYSKPPSNRSKTPQGQRDKSWSFMKPLKGTEKIEMVTKKIDRRQQKAIPRIALASSRSKILVKTIFLMESLEFIHSLLSGKASR